MKKQKRLEITERFAGENVVELDFKLVDVDVSTKNYENDVLDLVDILSKIKKGECKTLILNGIWNLGLQDPEKKFEVCFAYHNGREFLRCEKQGQMSKMSFSGWIQDEEEIKSFDDLNDRARMFIIMLSGEINHSSVRKGKDQIPVIIKTKNGDIVYSPKK